MMIFICADKFLTSLRFNRAAPSTNSFTVHGQHSFNNVDFNESHLENNQIAVYLNTFFGR
jgi:hypothetical protein